MTAFPNNTLQRLEIAHLIRPGQSVDCPGGDRDSAHTHAAELVNTGRLPRSNHQLRCPPSAGSIPVRLIREPPPAHCTSGASDGRSRRGTPKPKRRRWAGSPPHGSASTRPSSASVNVLGGAVRRSGSSVESKAVPCDGRTAQCDIANQPPRSSGATTGPCRPRPAAAQARRFSRCGAPPGRTPRAASLASPVEEIQLPIASGLLLRARATVA